MGEVRFKTQEQVDTERLEDWRANAKVSKFQAKAALKQAGLLQQARDMMAALPDDDLVRLGWEDAQEFRRNSPAVLSMAEELGLTPEQLDSLFEDASTIEA